MAELKDRIQEKLYSIPLGCFKTTPLVLPEGNDLYLVRIIVSDFMYVLHEQLNMTDSQIRNHANSTLVTESNPYIVVVPSGSKLQLAPVYDQTNKGGDEITIYLTANYWSLK